MRYLLGKWTSILFGMIVVARGPVNTDVFNARCGFFWLPFGRYEISSSSEDELFLAWSIKKPSPLKKKKKKKRK